MTKDRRALRGWFAAAALTVSLSSLPGCAVAVQVRTGREAEDCGIRRPSRRSGIRGGRSDRHADTARPRSHRGLRDTFRSDRRFFDSPEAEVRQAEASAACKIVGATPKFFPYAHEKLVADQALRKRFPHGSMM